jgi:hypothetical protein
MQAKMTMARTFIAGRHSGGTTVAAEASDPSRLSQFRNHARGAAWKPAIGVGMGDSSDFTRSLPSPCDGKT